MLWCSLLPAGSTDKRSAAEATPRDRRGAPRPPGWAHSGPPRVWGLSCPARRLGLVQSDPQRTQLAREALGTAHSAHVCATHGKAMMAVPPTAARFGLPTHFCAAPLAASEPPWGTNWGQGRRARAQIRPPPSRKRLAVHCRAAAAR